MRNQQKDELEMTARRYVFANYPSIVRVLGWE